MSIWCIFYIPSFCPKSCHLQYTKVGGSLVLAGKIALTYMNISNPKMVEGLLLLPRMCAPTRTHTRTHTHACTHAHTYTHTHTRTHIHTHTHTRIHTCTHTGLLNDAYSAKVGPPQLPQPLGCHGYLSCLPTALATCEELLHEHLNNLSITSSGIFCCCISESESTMLLISDFRQ